MSLDISEWKPFLIGRIFTVKYGVNLELDSLNETSEEGCVNFVSRCISDNGVSAKVEPISGIEPQAAGIISVAGGGSSVLSTYVQEEPFYSGRDLYLLIPKIDLSKETKLFITTVIEKNKYRYSFGRQANKTLPFLEILLPVKRCDGAPFFDNKKEYSDDGYIPDWQFMEDYIKSLHHKPLTTNNANSSQKKLDTSNWKDFVFNKVFKLVGGFYNKKPEHSTEGNFPFLGSTDSNNGVTEYYTIEDIQSWSKTGQMEDTLEKKIFEGNCIAVTVNGSVCNAYYQPDKFTCSHDITAFYLKHHEMNVYLAMFLCTIINNEKYRWSYGRKPHDVKKFGKSIVKLPVKCDTLGKPIKDSKKKYSNEGYVPDWDYMEDFIKSLPYSDRI